MYALTLKQPWASAIVYGPKRIENRTWRPRSLEWPAWIAVHAGKSMEAEALDFVAEQWPEVPPERELPRGAVIGAMRITEIITPEDCPGDPWAVGPECWRIDEVVALEEPIAARGYPGLWEPTAETVEKLEMLIQEVSR